MDTPFIETFRLEKWRTSSIEEKRKAIETLSESIAAQEGRNNSPINFPDMPSNFLGNYNPPYLPAGESIDINHGLLEKNEPYEAIETVFHENRHAYQVHVIFDPELAKNEPQASDWFKDQLFTGYIDGDNDPSNPQSQRSNWLYRYQPVEDDAHKVARDRTNQYCENVLNEGPSYSSYRTLKETEYAKQESRAAIVLGPDFRQEAKKEMEANLQKVIDQQRKSKITENHQQTTPKDPTINPEKEPNKHQEKNESTQEQNKLEYSQREQNNSQSNIDGSQSTKKTPANDTESDVNEIEKSQTELIQPQNLNHLDHNQGNNATQKEIIQEHQVESQTQPSKNEDKSFKYNSENEDPITQDNENEYRKNHDFLDRNEIIDSTIYKPNDENEVRLQDTQNQFFSTEFIESFNNESSPLVSDSDTAILKEPYTDLSQPSTNTDSVLMEPNENKNQIMENTEISAETTEQFPQEADKLTNNEIAEIEDSQDLANIEEESSLRNDQELANSTENESKNENSEIGVGNQQESTPDADENDEYRYSYGM